MKGKTRPGQRRESATRAAVPESHNSYIYRDESGQPIFRVKRGPNKRFFQQHYENGKWIRGTRGVEKVLYNLQQVQEAAEETRVIWIVEGEKDADALIELGLVATTNPGGAGKWRDDYSYSLLGVRRVHLVWDNDEQDPRTGKYPGQEHALEIEASLRKFSIPIRFYKAKEGKDVSDHLAAGYAIGDLVHARPAPPGGPPMPPLVVAATNGHSGPSEPSSNGHRPLPAVFQLALYKLREHAAENNLPQPRKTDVGYEVCCPAHDDRSPSLGIRVGETQPLVVKCQTGCTLPQIAEALDIDIREFGTKLPDHSADTEKELNRMRAQREARLALAGEIAPKIEVPYIDPQTYLTRPLPEYPYTIEELHVTGSNTLVVSRYKVGKSLMMINLFRSLVNFEPFLGYFGVKELKGRVAFLDYELQESQFRRWLVAGGELKQERMVAPWHLRGKSLHFWANSVREKFVDWLQANDVKVLIVDTAARAWAGLVENENDNSQILHFTDTLDSIKEEAGVVDLFLVTHMGRNVFVPEGEERARGATRLEDWMDSGWYLTKDETGTRYLRAIGRGVDVEPFALTYQPDTHLLMTNGVSRREHQNQEGLLQIVDALSRLEEPPNTSELKELIPIRDPNLKQRLVVEAETRGLITRTKGSGRTMRCELTDIGRALHERRVKIEHDEEDHDV